MRPDQWRGRRARLCGRDAMCGRGCARDAWCGSDGKRSGATLLRAGAEKVAESSSEGRVVQGGMAERIVVVHVLVGGRRRGSIPPVAGCVAGKFAEAVKTVRFGMFVQTAHFC